MPIFCADAAVWWLWGELPPAPFAAVEQLDPPTFCPAGQLAFRKLQMFVDGGTGAVSALVVPGAVEVVDVVLRSRRVMFMLGCGVFWLAVPSVFGGVIRA